MERPGARWWVPERPTLDTLRAAVNECQGCELYVDATQGVMGDGPEDADLMVVGEQPGDHEDREGEPFVGPAGRLLDRAIEEAGIARREIYLTNAVKHFRFERRGKRRIHEKPNGAQIEACHPWLSAELGTVRPDVIVCLGATAGRSVLGRPVRVTAERGNAINGAVGLEDAKVLITTHPSAVLRLRGKPEWDEAFDAFVADLHAAGRLLGG